MDDVAENDGRNRADETGSMEHVTDAVFDNQNEILCKECEKKFASKYLLKKHISNVHTINYPVRCNICLKTFKNKTTLKIHMKNLHKRPADVSISI